MKLPLPLRLTVASLVVAFLVLFSGCGGGGSSSGGSANTTSSSTNTNIGSISASGATICVVFGGEKLATTTNAGTSWTISTPTTGLGEGLTVAPAISGSTIYAGTSGGVAVSNNAGTSWTTHSVWGYPVECVAVSGQTIYAGTMGFGLAVSTDGGASWRVYNSENTLLDSDFVYSLAVSGSNIFLGTDTDLAFSLNDGGTWSETLPNGNNQITDVAISGTTICESSYSETNANGSWVGGVSLANTSNPNAWTHYTTANGLGSNNVNAVTISGSTIYAATSGGVSVSTNNGSTWTNYTTANGLPINNVAGVATSGSAVYATTAGGLSVSINGGKTWSNVVMPSGVGSNALKHT
ncbi:MAG: hypothetical protein P4L33_04300 [Capsulimonadaceae bacterium]|nr:hypothetical protein [Capsulimonadaceae bacterium]